jgi:transcriptional regulator with XRE-family HTH domain
MLRVKEICREKGLTVAEVAKRMNISAPALSATINGNPTYEMLQRIATALVVPVTALFEEPATDIVNCPACGARLELKRKG